MEKFQNLLNKVEQEIKDLRECPEVVSSFIALETTLQDLAREAHNEAYKLAKAEADKKVNKS